jgi:hypothetical protein
MRRSVLVVILVAGFGIPGSADAGICSMDVVPASTLLFPFVIYDYDADGSGQTTIFSITNVSSRAQIVRVTLWSDYSMAVLNFNIVLTGYDLQSINIRDILRDGVLPNVENGANIWWDGTGTSNAGGSPFDDGPYSRYNAVWGGALDSHFAASGLPDPESTNSLECDPTLWATSPNNYTDDIPDGVLHMFEGFLRASERATTGYRGCDWAADVFFPGGTWFTNQESRPTVLYITADVVGSCNRGSPGGDDSYYFPVGGIQTANVLMGDVVYLDPSTGFSEAENAVHIEAAPGGTLGSTKTDSGFDTGFYSRYHNAHAPSMREPLPTAWGFRYIHSNNGQADTWIRAWKGSTNNSLSVDLDDTNTGPGGTISSLSPSSLYASTCIPYTYYAWDDDENVNSASNGSPSFWSDGEPSDPIPVPNLLPLATQEIPVEDFFLVEDDFHNAYGWMMVIWPRSNTAGSTGAGTFPVDQYQTWMSVKYKAFGRLTSAMQALVIANFNCDDSQHLPLLGIDLHGAD